MNETELIKLIQEINQSNLAYFHYEKADLKLILAKEMPQIQAEREFVEQAPIQKPAHKETAVIAEDQSEAVEVTQAQDATPADDADLLPAPMVGVAYLQSAPDQDPFVKVGDQVEAGDTVMIIEAMKLMNEIEAHKSGIVTEILVENETVVEFGQALVRIK